MCIWLCLYLYLNMYIYPRLCVHTPLSCHHPLNPVKRSCRDFSHGQDGRKSSTGGRKSMGFSMDDIQKPKKKRSSYPMVKVHGQPSPKRWVNTGGYINQYMVCPCHLLLPWCMKMPERILKVCFCVDSWCNCKPQLILCSESWQATWSLLFMLT